MDGYVPIKEECGRKTHSRYKGRLVIMNPQYLPRTKEGRLEPGSRKLGCQANELGLHAKSNREDSRPLQALPFFCITKS